MTGSTSERRQTPSKRAQEPLPDPDNKVVTKKEIVRTLSTIIGMTQMETKEIIQKTFHAIVEALVEGGAPTATERGGRIELRNFGVFEIKRRARARPATRAPGQGFPYRRNSS